MSSTKVLIECTIEESELDKLLSLLRRMQYDGNIGHSETCSIFVDGDGMFRPRFNILNNRKLNHDFRGLTYLSKYDEFVECDWNC